MSAIRRFIDKLRNRPPRIDTPFGPVTEWARRQAAENMYLDPVKRTGVEILLAEQLGSVEAGIKESRKRFPEAYRDEAKRS
jgi:hypothetical protein